MNTLESLGQLIAEEEDALLEQHDDLETARERLLSEPSGKALRKRRFGPILALAAALALVLGMAMLFVRQRPEPLSFTVGDARLPGIAGEWLSASDRDALAVEFSDGSRFVLSRSARARIAALDASGGNIVVESGHAQFSVVPRKDAHWNVTLGPFAVQVTGTRFSVDWDPGTELLVLNLSEGRVQISGCVFAEGRPVAAGETVRASCKDRRIEITSSRTEPAPEPAAASSVDPPVSSPAKAVTAHSAALPPHSTKPDDSASASKEPAWRRLAQSGDYRNAFSAAEAAGFEGLSQTASASDLLLLGDAARLSGQLDKAERAYLALRQRFPADARARVAAFTLARVAFDQRGAHAEAARWLETYLREQPSGPLVREALGRLIEARQRSGDSGRARQAAEDYVARYPSGPHAELAQRLLAR